MPQQTSAWHFPDDKKAIRSQEPPIGTATGVNERGDGYLGWVTSMVIYDGKLESTVDMNPGNGPFVFHLPSWVA